MPLRDDMELISTDEHVIEHRNVWQDRLAERFKERGPRNVRDAEGRDVWWYEGQPHYTVGLSAVAGRPHAEFTRDPVSYDEMRPGCYDPAERIKDMDEDGVWGALCYGTFAGFAGFAGSTFLRSEDHELGLACVQAYNDWMLDEWCAFAPDRFIPLVYVPMWDPEAAATEVQRVAGKGARAVSFSEAPHALGLPSYHSDHWDPFLAAVQDADLPLCLHFGSGGVPSVATDSPFAVSITLFGLNSQMATVDLLFSQIFHKFPRLRVALSEGGIGWIPYILERADYVWERHRWYTDVNTDSPPSQLFREHVFGCFISDFAGLHSLSLTDPSLSAPLNATFGADYYDNVTFEADYPHSDCNWPNDRKVFAEQVHDLPDEVVRKIAESNARRVFKFPR